MIPMAITMGDASGVGPEIVLRQYAAGELDDNVLVYGDAEILRAGGELLGLSLEPHVVTKPDDRVSGRLNVIDLARLEAGDLTPGVLNKRSGRAARDYVEKATLDALEATVAGVVTLPMNKQATQMSDQSFVGHTEFIAGLCGVTNFSMMLTTSDVAVSHVSTHVALSEAIGLVTAQRVGNVIELTHNTLARFIENPRIAVCGLNPHAGEHGLFGTEEVERV